MKFVKIACYFLLTAFIPFVRADIGWNLPSVAISPSTDDVKAPPQVCCDSSGNAFAVWSATLPITFDIVIQASYFDSTTLSWSYLGQVSDGAEPASNPSICCDDSGNAFAVWQENSAQAVKASRFDSSSMSWSTPVPLSGFSSDPSPQVCCDNSGNAIAIWIGISGINEVVQAARFNGTSWQPLVNLSAPLPDVIGPQVCCDNSGNANAVWTNNNGVSSTVQASHFNGSSWTAVVDVFSLSTPGQVLDGPQICCNESGNAFAVWSKLQGFDAIVQSSYFNGSSWTGADDVFILSPSGQSSVIPKVCCDNSGNAIAIWVNFDFIDGNSVEASRFNGSTWEPVGSGTPISPVGGDIISTQLCCDNSGNATAIWNLAIFPDATIQSANFDNTSLSWSSPLILSTSGVLSTDPAICCSDSGGKVAVWFAQGDPNGSIQGAYFLSELPSPLTPPENFSGARLTNRFPTQSTVSARLCWTPNIDPTVTSFNIYRNGHLITTISSSLSCYKDCNIDPCQSYIYSITSLNSSGDESNAEAIVI